MFDRAGETREGSVADVAQTVRPPQLGCPAGGPRVCVLAAPVRFRVSGSRRYAALPPHCAAAEPLLVWSSLVKTQRRITLLQYPLPREIADLGREFILVKMFND